MCDPGYILASGATPSMLPTEEPNPNEPLVMRSYRRHRRQAKWGTYSLFMPLATGLWGVFWYLMMSKPRMPGASAGTSSTEWLTMMIGVAVISLIGVVMAAAGMLDGYHKHGRAAAGLAINSVILVTAVIMIFFRVFSQSVG